MRTVEEQVIDNIMEAEKVKTESEIVQDVLNILDEMRARGFSDLLPGELTEFAGQLSILNINLGQVTNEWEMEWEMREVDRQIGYEQKFLELKEDDTVKMTQRDREAVAKRETLKNYREQIKAKFIFKTFKNLHEGIDNLIPVMLNRRNHLAEERKNSGTFQQ